MTRLKRPSLVLLVASMVAAAGCSSAGSSSDGGTDATFTMAIPTDPAGLDPMHASEGVTQNVLRFAYDSLLAFPDSGEPEPYLAESWETTPDSVTYTLKDGITCSDGSPFTAEEAAAVINFAVDPENQTDYLRDLPKGIKAVASGADLTVTVAQPDPFLLYKIGEMLMVCPAALSDPDSLDEQSQGTGMFVLQKAVTGDHYKFTRRDDFRWGPNGTTAEEEGLPKEVVLRVIPNETTAVNLLASGEVHVTGVLGPERQRAASVADVEHQITTPLGLTFYNQAAGRPGADEAVRHALTMATNMDALVEVMTDGTGERAKRLVTIPPDPCGTDTVAGAFPDFDTKKAAAELDAAGWELGSDGVRSKDGKPLRIKFIYNSALGDGVVAASELLRSDWKKIGVDLKITGFPPSRLGQVVYETGDWDAGWLPITVGLPSYFVDRVSGETPPKGSNFAWIDNDEYEKEAALAASLPLEEACAHWDAAEKALFRSADLVPVANGTLPTFGKGVDFRLQGGLIDPSSLRMGGE